MVSSIGFALGAGSGLDTAKLIEELAAANRAPKEAAIKKREEANSARISALAEASNAISSFSGALAALIGGGSLRTQPVVSDGSVLAAKSIPGFILPDTSTQIEVKQTALGQHLRSAALPASDAPVGEGTLTLAIPGREPIAITIGSTNNSLEGLVKEINGKKAGVTASIVSEQGAAYLVLKGSAGEAQAFTLSVPEGTSSGLERFAYGPSASGGMTQMQAARDAILVVDGIEVKRGTNVISDLIPGMEIELKKDAPGTRVQIGIQRPTEAIKQAVSDFIDAFNELQKAVSGLAAAGTNGSAGGPLKGDIGVQGMLRKLNALAGAQLRSGDGPRTLGDIGVRTNRDGSLSLDQKQWSIVVEHHLDGLEGLFNPTQYSSNPAIDITSLIGKVKPGTYKLTDIVPAGEGTSASGKIDNIPLQGIGAFLVAPSTSAAAGLVLKISGAVSEATITVEPGLGGVLQAIKEELLASGGPMNVSNERAREDAADIEEDRMRMEARVTAYRDRLVSTYAVMERRVAAFKATQSYLEQQIKAWNSSND
jgi:flagellar hook-associated protein 2